MARCGCAAAGTCGCSFVGDGTTAEVSGNGTLLAPYEASILAYPRPRPFLFLTRTATTALLSVNQAPTAPPISFQTALYISDPTMWNGSTRMIARTAGKYLVTAGSNDGWAANPIQGRIVIVQNGTAIRSYATQVWDAIDGPFLTTTLVDMALNDTLELQIEVSTNQTLRNAYMIVRWMGF